MWQVQLRYLVALQVLCNTKYWCLFRDYNNRTTSKVLAFSVLFGFYALLGTFSILPKPVRLLLLLGHGVSFLITIALI